MRFRCINDLCKVEEDKVLAGYMGKEPQLLLPVIDPPEKDRRDCYRGGIPYKTCCHKCKKETNKTLCPHCHNILPPHFGHEESLTIALVGASSAGKSNYLGVLINELEKRILPRIGGSLLMKTENTRQRYKKDFYDPLFRNDKAVAVQKTLSANRDVRNPLFFRLEFKAEKKFFQTVIPGVNLIFFDTAGESLNDVDAASIAARYVGYAQGIIFIIDPLQIGSVRNIVPAEVNIPQVSVDQDAVLQRIITLVREVNGMPGNVPIKVPMALAFSKIDALRSLIEDSPNIFKRNEFRGTIAENDLDCINEEMIAFMKDNCREESILSLVANHFSNNHYFAFSALGDIPDKDNHLRRGVSGLRVEDPLLWILHKNKLIKSSN